MRDEKNDPAENGEQNIHIIADAGEYGHNDIAVLIGEAGILPHFFVDGFKIQDRLSFVGENFDDFFPMDDLFDKSFELCGAGLLGNEALRRSSAEFFYDDEHGSGAGIDGNGEPYRYEEHCAGEDDEGKDRIDKLDHALGNKLTDGVDVVGVVGHDVAVFIGIEIGDGQRFHCGKHFFAQTVQGLLSEARHDAGIGKSGDGPQSVDENHGGDKHKKASRNGVKSFGEGRGDHVVHEEEKKDAGGGRCDRRKEKANDDDGHFSFVFLKYVAYEPFHAGNFIHG